MKKQKLITFETADSLGVIPVRGEIMEIGGKKFGVHFNKFNVWTVTHLESGMSFAQSVLSKNDAIAAAVEKMPKLEEAIKKNVPGARYQQWLIDHEATYPLNKLWL